MKLVFFDEGCKSGIVWSPFADGCPSDDSASTLTKALMGGWATKVVLVTICFSERIVGVSFSLLAAFSFCMIRLPPRRRSFSAELAKLS